MAKKEYRQLSAQEETAFILMVLLDEGKSNLPYRLLRCLTSVHFANQYYLKRLFSGYRSLNYNFYRDKFEKELLPRMHGADRLGRDRQRLRRMDQITLLPSDKVEAAPKFRNRLCFSHAGRACHFPGWDSPT